MKYRLDVKYDTIHEMDGDLPGGVIGFHLEGHVDYQTVEEFLAYGEVEEYGFDDIQDWDVTLTYMKIVPWVSDSDEENDSWGFAYSDEPKEGYLPVTKIETAWIARHFCSFHPMEPYSMSVSADSFEHGTVSAVLSEPTSWTGRRPPEFEVHLCKECAAEYHVRWQKAYDQAMLEVEFDNRQKAAA